jgi:hypothetical protein
LGRAAHHPFMTTKLTHLKVAPAILALLLVLGCSKQSPDQSESGRSSSAAKGAATQDDARADEIMKSPDIMEARDWVKRYPNSVFGKEGTPFPPIVERLTSAGAPRVVVHHFKSSIFLGVVVVLPTDPGVRQKVFALEPELSQLALQRQAQDHGQKYLYYSFQ